MDANKTVTGGFEINTYSLTLNAVHGSVVATPAKASYTHGETVSLQATADAGYHFTGWSGAASGSTNPTTITMDGNKTVNAEFAIQQRQLVVSSTPGGSVITPGHGVFQYDSGMKVNLDARPQDLFEFAGWEGSTSSTANPLTLVMDGDQQIRACFVSVLDVLHVDDDTPGDPSPSDPGISDQSENGTPQHPFDTIQEAIDVAKHHATVVVRTGVYFETLDMLGKSITVSGLSSDPNQDLPPQLPIVDGQYTDVVVKCTRGEDANCVLSGLIITRGRATLVLRYA
jgi:uncharacterized repeat protein (TIGR02543 family)